ncbi:hypothetical protein ACJX0J_017911, partial [Zea mays]
LAVGSHTLESFHLVLCPPIFSKYISHEKGWNSYIIDISSLGSMSVLNYSGWHEL